MLHFKFFGNVCAVVYAQHKEKIHCMCLILKSVLITVVEEVNSTALIVLMFYVLNAHEYIGSHLKRIKKVFNRLF